MTALNQSPFLYALGWAIAGSLWQMALLWIIYQVCFNIHRKVGPSLRHLVSTSFLMAGFVWFCISLVQKYVEQSALQQYMTAMPTLDDPATAAKLSLSFTTSGWNTITALADQYLPYISAAYLFVLGFLGIRLVNAFLYSQKLRTSGLLEIDKDWIELVREYGNKIGIKRNIRIYLSKWIDVPATIGYLKPIILLPIAAFNHLSVQQVEAIVLHELSHIRRNDYLINILVSVVETILFFNPFAYLLSKSLKKERENCCDDFVLKFQCDPHSYASALLSLEKLRLNSSQYALAATGENKHQLLGRVRRIMNVNTRSFNYGQKLLALLTTAFILISLAWLTPPDTTISTAKPEAILEPKKLNIQLSDEIGSPFANEKKQNSRESNANQRRRYKIESVDGASNFEGSDIADFIAPELGWETKKITLPPGLLVFNQPGFSKFKTMTPPGRVESYSFTLPQQGYATTAPANNFEYSYSFPEFNTNPNLDQWLPKDFEFKNLEGNSLVLKLSVDKIKQAFKEINWDKIELQWKESGQKGDWDVLQNQLKEEFAKELINVYGDAEAKRDLYANLGLSEARAYRKAKSEYEEKEKSVHERQPNVYYMAVPAPPAPVVRVRPESTPRTSSSSRSRLTVPKVQLQKNLEQLKWNLSNLTAAGEKKGQPLFFSYNVADQELAAAAPIALNMVRPSMKITKNHTSTTITIYTKKKTNCNEVQKKKTGKAMVIGDDDPDGEDHITITTSDSDDDDDN